jgi:hypothetical protein
LKLPYGNSMPNCLISCSLLSLVAEVFVYLLSLRCFSGERKGKGFLEAYGPQTAHRPLSQNWALLTLLLTAILSHTKGLNTPPRLLYKEVHSSTGPRVAPRGTHSGLLIFLHFPWVVCSLDRIYLQEDMIHS